MTLKRIWTPSPNYSSGGTKRLLVIHTMEGFTGPNGAYDCAHYFQGNVGASSHVCIDNNRGTVWEGVTRNNAAWTQCGFNGVAIACEQSGYASWSRDYWLANRDAQLWNIADWLREESGRTGIPLVRLTANQAQSNGRGVCGHIDLGSSGCGHVDPGNGWPWDIVLQRAIGGSQPPPEEMAGINMPSSVILNNRLHMVGVWEDGRPHYQFESEGWYPIDPADKFTAKSGADITVNYNTGHLVVSVTGTDGNMYTWQQTPPDVNGPAIKGKWTKYGRGGWNSVRLWRQLPISF